jgi:hypothetical protein
MSFALLERRLLFLLLGLIVLVAKPARADVSTAHSVAVAVLAFDSDDAEEQADALTGALRSRVRASQGWSLIETTQSLGMLTAALRCPGKPIPADCEQRIADQIKTERFIFGYVTRGPQPNTVTAEVHLYQRSRPDTVMKESYADNLRDQNDDSLRKIAQKLLDRLGSNAVGIVVVKGSGGEVVIDGDKRVPLSNGTARIELAPGSHSVELALSDKSSQKRNVLVTAGKETLVDLSLSGTAPAEAPRGPSTFPTRKVVGGALAVLGVGAAVFSVVNVLAYQDDQDHGDALQASTNPAIRKLPAGKKADDVCGTPEFPDVSDICIANDDAKRHSAIAIASGAAGAALIGVGAYLFFADPGEREKKSGAPKLRPTFGRGSAGLSLVGRF